MHPQETTPVSSWRLAESSPESTTVSPDPSIRATPEITHRAHQHHQPWDQSPPKHRKENLVLTPSSPPGPSLLSDGHEPSMASNLSVQLKSQYKKNRRLLTFLGIVFISFTCVAVFFHLRFRHIRVDDARISSHLLDELSETSSRGLRSRIRLFDWNQHTEREVKRHRIKTLHILFYDSTDPEAPIYEEAMKEVASNFYKQNILHVRVRKELMRDFQFFLPEDPELYVPFSTIVEVDRGFRKYRCPEDPTSSLSVVGNKNQQQNVKSLREQLSSFEEQYFGAQLREKAWLRSDRAFKIDEQDESNVKQLVGSEFQANVVKAYVDVLVFFYAPWCGHCKRFEKYFAELADSFSHVTTLKFFKLDVTKNDVDHPLIVIHRVPYVRLFKMHDKETPIPFEHAHADLAEYGKNFLLQNIVTDGVGIEL